MKREGLWKLGAVSLSLMLTVLTLTFVPKDVQASDHDEGEVDTKGRNVNLTDLYVFREQDENPSVRQDDLIFVMNTNPRSLARQQYFFSTNAFYEFKVTRVANKDETPTGKQDVTLRFQFGAPNDKGEQDFLLTAIMDGYRQEVAKGTTF